MLACWCVGWAFSSISQCARAHTHTHTHTRQPKDQRVSLVTSIPLPRATHVRFTFHPLTYRVWRWGALKSRSLFWTWSKTVCLHFYFLQKGVNAPIVLCYCMIMMMTAGKSWIDSCNFLLGFWTHHSKLAGLISYFKYLNIYKYIQIFVFRPEIF